MATSVWTGFDEYTPDDNGTSTGSSNGSNDGIIYPFTPKHQLSTKNNPLCGICLPEWLELLSQRCHQIEWQTYWPRLLVISLLACVNSFLAVMERFLYGKRIRETKLHPRPVFVLGHPRTGTTLLHSLLAADTNQFAICSTFCAGFPSCFLWFEGIGKRLFSGVMDETRPMDNVRLHFDLPQEDELATNVLSAGTSPYMPLFFMQQEQEFRPFYAFDTEKESTSPRAKERWTRAFLYLCRKLTLRGERRQPSSQHRLLLKSPVHTARIPLLLSLFPEAQFIYIHRHPYQVFRSAAHMADTTYWYTYLNTPSNEQIQEFILQQYELLWDYYEQGRGLLRDDQLVEVSYDELSTDPVATVQRIYQHFGWDGWNNVHEKLCKELGDVQSYQRNQHAPLSPKLAAIVRQRWGPSFERLGYNG